MGSGMWSWSPAGPPRCQGQLTGNEGLCRGGSGRSCSARPPQGNNRGAQGSEWGRSLDWLSRCCPQQNGEVQTKPPWVWYPWGRPRQRPVPGQGSETQRLHPSALLLLGALSAPSPCPDPRPDTQTWLGLSKAFPALVPHLCQHRVLLGVTQQGPQVTISPCAHTGVSQAGGNQRLWSPWGSSHPQDFPVRPLESLGHQTPRVSPQNCPAKAPQATASPFARALPLSRHRGQWEPRG